MRSTVHIIIFASFVSSLLECAVNESVFCIHYARFTVGVCLLKYTLRSNVTCLKYLISVWECAYYSFRFAVVLKKFDRKIAGGVMTAQFVVLLKKLLNISNTVLNLMPIVDVNMPCNIVSRTIAVGIIFFMRLVFVGCFPFVVPLLYFFSHFSADLALFVDIELTLIHVYDDVEKHLHTSTSSENSGNHRNTQQGGEGVEIKLIASFFSFVKHVQCTYHRYVHVDKLCGEVEVTFYIACVDYINDYIGSMLDKLFSYVKLFRRMALQRLVDYLKLWVASKRCYQPLLKH